MENEENTWTEQQTGEISRADTLKPIQKGVYFFLINVHKENKIKSINSNWRRCVLQPI